jgi:membrane protein implicated in regulation of membrane protease activity
MNTMAKSNIFSMATATATNFINDIPTLLQGTFSIFVDNVVEFIITLINGPPANRQSSLQSLFFLILNTAFITILIFLLCVTSAWQGYQMSYFAHVGLGMQPEDFANYQGESEKEANDRSSGVEWERRVKAWKEAIGSGAYAGWWAIFAGGLICAALFYRDGYELWTGLIIATLRASAFVWACVLFAVGVCRMIVPSLKEALAWMKSMEETDSAADIPDRKGKLRTKVLEAVSEEPEPGEAAERRKRYIMRLRHSAKTAAEGVTKGNMYTMSDFERRGI